MREHNIALHNVAELDPVNGGMLFKRAPQSLLDAVNPNAQTRLKCSSDCEIRFVSPGEVKVTLSTLWGEADMTVLHGVFAEGERPVIREDVQTFTIKPPPDPLLNLDPKVCARHHFDPRVTRLVFGGRRREPVILHGLEGPHIQPPSPDTLPKLRYLAYGSSITEGFHCEGPQLSYVAQTAWHLKADLINLGVAGSCHAEPAFGDYIAERTDWDIASLELSANMTGFPIDEFRKRVDYIVNRIAGADSTRPVACVTVFPSYSDCVQRGEGGDGPAGGIYRQALREIVDACPHPNVHLIEGPELLTEIGGLSADLVHPSDHAMIEMGRNLADRLAALL